MLYPWVPFSPKIRFKTNRTNRIKDPNKRAQIQILKYK